MGGNALAPLKTRRVTAREYYQLEAEIAAILIDTRISLCPIRHVRTKESFGDIDIVVRGDLTTLAADVTKWFNPTVVKTNGNVISFDYKNVQVDLIVFERFRDAEFASDYYSYGELGNLLGRVAASLGFKFRHNGLFYPLYAPDNPSHLIADIPVSETFDSAIDLLGCNLNRFYLGFHGPEDVYEFVAASKYFNPEIFFLHNRNNASRTRAKKRPGYLAAIEYYKDKFNLSGLEPAKHYTDGEKFEFLSYIMANDYSFSNEYHDALAKYEVKDKIAAGIPSDVYLLVNKLNSF